MKIALKEYQEQAVAEVLKNLRLAATNYEAGRALGSMSLSAPTGSGKTVIAAAVIERVLYGDSSTGDALDPDAVILWITDDPSLNQQTRKKILEASDLIQPSQLIVVDDGFDEPEFEPGKVYFLNIQKLSKSSNLVKRNEGTMGSRKTGGTSVSRRKHPIWETMTATIKRRRSSYWLIRDEAHRGAKRRSKSDETIAQRLVSGGDGVVEPAPLVLGISATPGRFDEEMDTATPARVVRARWAVPVDQVRESGLIKDVLSLHYRGEEQKMEATLIRRAVASLRESDDAWTAYTDAEGDAAVRPILVIQVPPDGDAIVSDLLDICADEWDLLKGDAIAHCLQSHTAEQFGSHTVKYIEPQNIQDHPTVRVVLFKEALTTGWDCPRAEVMLSLRTAKDDTYIAQLVGRMVRAPLARRIQANDALNRVLLFLPHFDHTAVEAVKAMLESGDDAVPSDVEISAVDARRNPNVPAAAFAHVEGLTSYVVPGPVHPSQVARLHRLAARLAGDGLLADAIKEADEFLFDVIETERKRIDSDGDLAPRIADVEKATMELQDVFIYEERDDDITRIDLATDASDLEVMFRGAGRRFRDGLANTYWVRRVNDRGDDPTDAKVLTVALAGDDTIVTKVEELAQSRVAQWLVTYGSKIQRLSEDKRAEYQEIRALARDPEAIKPTLPALITMPSEGDDISRLPSHLFSGPDGEFNVVLKGWEPDVLQAEMSDASFVAWYRNPTGGGRCLRLPYEKTTSEFGKMYPDFIVLNKDEGDNLVASIVDPHGHHLSDAGPKLRGLAAYAEKHGAEYQRIISVIKVASGGYRMLDLKDPTVRRALETVHLQGEIEDVFMRHGAVYG